MSDERWTAIPNYILDNMHEMKPGVFKIVMAVARLTLGYADKEDATKRREWHGISTSEFMELTGLSNRAVIDSVKDAIDTGWINRRSVGLQGFEYSIEPMKKVHKLARQTSEESSQANTETYEESSQVNAPTYEESSQVSDKSYEKSSQEPMKKVHSKEKKKRNINTSLRGKGAARSSLNGGSSPEHQQMFAKICDIVGWDHKALDEKSQGQVAQALGILKKAGYTLADLNDFGAKVWAHDWRWTKLKQRPTLTQLRQEIGKLRASDFKANGAASGGSTWEQAFANQEVAPYILKMQRGEEP